MKADFKNINSNCIKVGGIFYLYGNYKKTFEVFCDAIYGELQKKSLDPELNYCSVSECLKIINGQCDLFETKTHCFCLRNIEDNHLEKLSQLFSNKNNVFILESGNYSKSKKITDLFLKNSEILCVASFNNDTTLHSLCKMLFPNISQTVCNEIVKIINNTDEKLYSVFKKISFLLENNNPENLKDYSIYKRSFLEELNSISLIRLLLQSAIKEKIYEKSTDFVNLKSNEGIICFLLNTEIKQKSGFKINKSYIYQKLAFK